MFVFNVLIEVVRVGNVGVGFVVVVDEIRKFVDSIMLFVKIINKNFKIFVEEIEIFLIILI